MGDDATRPRVGPLCTGVASSRRLGKMAEEIYMRSDHKLPPRAKLKKHYSYSHSNEKGHTSTYKIEEDTINYLVYNTIKVAPQNVRKQAASSPNPGTQSTLY